MWFKNLLNFIFYYHGMLCFILSDFSGLCTDRSRHTGPGLLWRSRAPLLHPCWHDFGTSNSRTSQGKSDHQQHFKYFVDWIGTKVNFGFFSISTEQKHNVYLVVYLYVKSLCFICLGEGNMMWLSCENDDPRETMRPNSTIERHFFFINKHRLPNVEDFALEKLTFYSTN